MNIALAKKAIGKDSVSKIVRSLLQAEVDYPEDDRAKVMELAAHALIYGEGETDTTNLVNHVRVVVMTEELAQQ